MKKHVLIIDDQQSVCDATKRLLESEGMIVDAATSLDKAKRLISERCYDLALVDINLEDTNYLAQNTEGVDAIKYMKLFKDGTRIIVFSAQQSTQFVRTSFVELGINNYISKRETKPDEMLKIIESELNESKINCYGSTGDPIRGFSGTAGIEAEIWTTHAIDALHPSHGLNMIIKIAKKCLDKLGPLVPLKGKDGRIVSIDRENHVAAGGFWSRRLGYGIDLIIIPNKEDVSKHIKERSYEKFMTESNLDVIIMKSDLTIDDYDLKRITG